MRLADPSAAAPMIAPRRKRIARGTRERMLNVSGSTFAGEEAGGSAATASVMRPSSWRMGARDQCGRLAASSGPPAIRRHRRSDRRDGKSVVEGKRVEDRVVLGGRSI